MTKPEINSQKIYSVYAKHIDRNELLGHCQAGSFADIEAYYSDRQAYGLEVEEVKPVRIAIGYAERKSGLVQQRDALQKQIDDLDRQIAAKYS